MEVWKSIIGYEGYYEISNFGNVRSLERIVNHTKYGKQQLKARNSKKYITDKAYYEVALCKDNKAKRIFIHKLVAIHFIEKINLSKNQVNHIDSNKKNNTILNLEWVDNRENQCHKNIIKTSKYTGVSYCKDRCKFIACITINKKRTFLGRFNTEIEAKKVYDNFCKENNIVNKYQL
jgi:hypothetical protein